MYYRIIVYKLIGAGEPFSSNASLFRTIQDIVS